MTKHRSLDAIILAGILWISAVSIALPVHAAGEVRVMFVSSDEEHVRAYIRGADAADEASYQIGNVPVEGLQTYPVSESDYPVHTLMLLDNSFSIPTASRELIKEAMDGIVNSHADGEMFRLATFADEIHYLSDRYSDDYTALVNMIDKIDYENQDTMLTDVLSGVVAELNSEGYEGYTRIIVISDGVNNKPVGGVTLERLMSELKNSPYPVYTIGSNTGKNEELLDNMFSLSWQTGAEYIVLENSEVSDITDITTLDNAIMVYEAVIPEEAKTGGRQSSKLTLGDGTELVFDVTMPFSIRQQPEPEPEPEPIQEPEPEPEPKPGNLAPPISEIDTEPEKQEIPLAILIAAIVSAVAAVALVAIFIVLRLRRKRAAADKGTPVLYGPPVADDIAGTMILDQGDSGYDKTVQLTPSVTVGERKRFILLLTDSADSGRSFRCELAGEVRIGRRTDNNIAITDDIAVHGHHCVITTKNDTFYITDLDNVKNHCAVNGITLKPGIPQLIVNNSRVTIGRHSYVVNIAEE